MDITIPDSRPSSSGQDHSLVPVGLAEPHQKMVDDDEALALGEKDDDETDEADEADEEPQTPNDEPDTLLSILSITDLSIDTESQNEEGDGVEEPTIPAVTAEQASPSLAQTEDVLSSADPFAETSVISLEEVSSEEVSPEEISPEEIPSEEISHEEISNTNPFEIAEKVDDNDAVANVQVESVSSTLDIVNDCNPSPANPDEPPPAASTNPFGDPAPEPQTPSSQSTNPFGDPSAPEPAVSVAEPRTSKEAEPRKGPHTSNVFVINALKRIAAAKESRRNKELQDAVAKVLEIVHDEDTDHAGKLAASQAAFTPLRLAAQTDYPALHVISLDSFEKLVSYEYFDNSQAAVIPVTEEAIEDDVPSQPTNSAQVSPGRRLIDDVVDTICECFVGEGTDEAVTLQIVKALLAAVLSQRAPIHEATLLRAIRTTYNIFLLSKSGVNQVIAQGSLTQMVNLVFVRAHEKPPTSALRAKILDEARNAAADSIFASAVALPESTDEQLNAPADDADHVSGDNAAAHDEEHSTSQNTVMSSDILTDNQAAGDDVSKAADATPALAAQTGSPIPKRTTSLHTEALAVADYAENINIRDAFLLFRSLCKLSMKAVANETAADLKSLSMRTKLLALRLIGDILEHHLPVFTMPTSAIIAGNQADKDQHIVTTSFVNAVKQYLCLSLSRNVVSVVPAVFECALDVFWKVMCGLRNFLKKEIEVFFKEIFLPVLEMKNSSYQQRRALLQTLHKVCGDPQLLVEIYINYDCDTDSMDNIYERLASILSKTITRSFGPGDTTSLPTTPQNERSSLASNRQTQNLTLTGGANSAALVINEGSLKNQSLDVLVAILTSLVDWANKGFELDEQAQITASAPVKVSKDSPRASAEGERPSSRNDAQGTSSPAELVSATDDPDQFHNQKNKKQKLQEGIRLFGWKPKRGIKLLVASGCIARRDPSTIAEFLLKTEGLNKAMIGEYLGEGDAENIAAMHAFVDLMDFTNMNFVDALRQFLQAFRLPGEAQKIDRFMLKFAERFVLGNPNAFANADTAYVLAYSVIMLNTDLHNPQVKRRMTKQEFIKNNRGINDNADLPHELLESIYDEIEVNEIKMKDDPIANSAALSITNEDLANRTDRQKQEAAAMMSKDLAMKTETTLKSMLRRKARLFGGQEKFYHASNFQHVRPMFEVAWMSFLAALSSPLRDSSDIETIRCALRGFSAAIHIAGIFDMELERDAFLTTLSKITLLNNFNEMKPKNIEAIKALLEIGVNEGNNLGRSWYDVLACVSRIEKYQSSADAANDGLSAKRNRRDSTSPAESHPRPTLKQPNVHTEEILAELTSQSVVVAVDKIFSSSEQLSGTSIVDFVRALCRVSFEELSGTADLEHPRMYSLTKLVEISYYNMNRIRVEWSEIWAILGSHFNDVGCHANVNAAFFAVDSLRQLAMKFLEKEELANFKFQREFFRPFYYTLKNNSDIAIKDMILRCFHQMISARASNIRSGWKTMLSVFSEAAREPNETIVSLAYETVKEIFRSHEEKVSECGSYADLIACLIEFCKNEHFQKISLNAIGLYRQAMKSIALMPQSNFDAMMASGNFSRASSRGCETSLEQVWFPILFGLFQVIMESNDLEVRARAVDYMFETLKDDGESFTEEFWILLFDTVLFPLFGDLRNPGRQRRFTNPDDMSVWLSSTLIKALRQMIDLFTFYFARLGKLLDGILDLIYVCITQGDASLARVSCTCFQELAEANAGQFTKESWATVAKVIVKLFKATSPILAVTSTPSDGITQSTLGGAVLPSEEEVRKESMELERCSVFCDKQLILLDMMSTLFIRQDAVATAMTVPELFQLTDATARSYRHAQKFNRSVQSVESNPEYSRLQPRLLEQEVGCLECCLHILLQLYRRTDDSPKERSEVERRFFPLGLDTLHQFVIECNNRSHQRARLLSKVVLALLDALVKLNDNDFTEKIPTFYDECVALVRLELPPEMRDTLFQLLLRVGQAFVAGSD